MNPNDKSTINVTLKLRNHMVNDLENFLKDKFDLIDFRIVPNTDAMYENDKIFQKLVKNRKKLKNEVLDYINKNNYKYIDKTNND